MKHVNQIISALAVKKPEIEKLRLASIAILKNIGLFSGLIRTYNKFNDADQSPPDETKNIQNNLKKIISDFMSATAEMISLTNSRELSNANCNADLKVGDKVIAAKVPVGTLIFLEKYIKEVRDFVTNLPILDPSFTWTWDASAGFYRSNETSTNSTKKLQKPIVMYDATDKHPAQTQLIVEDVVVGTWKSTTTSSCITVEDKEKYLAKISNLLHAIVIARDEANMQEGKESTLGASILDYLNS